MNAHGSYMDTVLLENNIYKKLFFITLAALVILMASDYYFICQRDQSIKRLQKELTMLDEANERMLKDVIYIREILEKKARSPSGLDLRAE